MRASTADAPRHFSRRASALPPDERRSMIVDAALPLLLQNGEMVTTKQIADAAGIAEGTIFRVFTDKDALIEAVIDSALDIEPLEAALSEIDLNAPFDECLVEAIAIMQERVVNAWRLFSNIGARFHERARRPITELRVLVAIFEANRSELSVKPLVAARLLRALTLSTTHPMLAEEPMSPREISRLLLHGIARSGRC